MFMKLNKPLKEDAKIWLFFLITYLPSRIDEYCVYSIDRLVIYVLRTLN